MMLWSRCIFCRVGHWVSWKIKDFRLLDPVTDFQGKSSLPCLSYQMQIYQNKLSCGNFRRLVGGWSHCCSKFANCLSVSGALGLGVGGLIGRWPINVVVTVLYFSLEVTYGYYCTSHSTWHKGLPLPIRRTSKKRRTCQVYLDQLTWTTGLGWGDMVNRWIAYL